MLVVPPTKDKKKVTLSRILFALFCVLLILVSFLMVRVQPPRAAQSVQVITSDWEPYVDTSAEKGGTVGDIVVSVLASSGYKAQVSFDAWGSGLEKVDQGTAFGIFPMVKSQSRDELFEYSDPLVDYTYVLFKRVEHTVPEAVLNGDLTGMRVGKIDGYDYWAELDSSGAEFRNFSSTVEGFQALANDEVDFLAESDIVGNATLQGAKFEGDASDFDIVTGSNAALSSTDSVHFLMRKNDLSRSVMDKFNESLAEYKNSERYREQVERLEGVADRVVFAGDDLIDVRNEAGNQVGSIPPGVEAQVLHWPNELQRGSAVTVKMLDGPMAGQIANVRLDDVHVKESNDV